MKSDFIDELIVRMPVLSCCKFDIEEAFALIASSYERGGKLLICGNGGSASDALHIAGELCKGFLSRRTLSESVKTKLRETSPDLDESILDSLQWGLPALVLTGSDALTTAFANDVDASLVYAQQVLAMGVRGDILLGISTSGNAKNVAAAAAVARGMGILAERSDVAIRVPAEETYLVQEQHLPVYHALCASLEDYFEKKGWGDRLCQI